MWILACLLLAFFALSVALYRHERGGRQ